MSTPTPETMLAAGLLNVCKQLLGRVRVLEELVASQPELAQAWREQRRFLAAYEEDEYKALTDALRGWLSSIEAGELDLELTLPPGDDGAGA